MGLKLFFETFEYENSGVLCFVLGAHPCEISVSLFTFHLVDEDSFELKSCILVILQIYCFDAGTLQNMYSVLTYPSPVSPPGSGHYGYGAMAVGPRWLAYAGNQPLVATTGRVSPQHLTPSPGASPSTSPANGSLVAHYAMESTKHIVAGVVTLSDIGYNKFKKYYSDLNPDGGNASPIGVGSPNWKNGTNGHSPWQGSPAPEPEFAGTVSLVHP